MTSNQFSLDLADEAQTLSFGAQLAASCGASAIIFLHGDLGAGKTTLTRGFLSGLGYHGKVKSPTYTLVEPYEINTQKIFHFDFYRLRDPRELEFIGIQDYFAPRTICLIEWPENGGDLLPAADLSCYIEPYLNGRQIRIAAHTPQGQQILQRLHGAQNNICR